MRADIEVIFHFNNNRKLYEGFRPSHLIDGVNLTTGVHHYYYDKVNNEIRGTIEFIAPEYYPKCLKVGSKIEMYEGAERIGFVEVLNIFNQILEE